MPKVMGAAVAAAPFTLTARGDVDKGNAEDRPDTTT
jgi:hypothetical protein